jgi:predicted RecB family endonuclease
MASRKYRPIVMNRNKKPARTYTVLQKMLLVIAVLVLVGVVILVVIHFKDWSKETVKTEEKRVDTGALKETPTVAGDNFEKSPERIKQAEPVAKKKSGTTKRTTQEITIPAIQKSVEDLSDAGVTPTKKVKEVKEVSNEKMLEILNELKMEKAYAPNSAKCVSIRIVSSSNAENGYKIAKFLRANGYVISGREVVKGNQDGIKITTVGPCIKLAIGTL